MDNRMKNRWRKGLVAVALLATLGVAARPGEAGEGSALIDRGNGIVEEVGGAGRMWQQERSGALHSLAEAEAYAKALTLGGYTDWRLPTTQELYDLYYLVDVKKAAGVALRLEGNYWATDPDGNGMAGSWEIGDQCEPSRSYFKKKWGYVRAVRP
ncbi:MAG: DUF1566 domain-containing protein [Thermodesulfobacteriota bacterium]